MFVLQMTAMRGKKAGKVYETIYLGNDVVFVGLCVGCSVHRAELGYCHFLPRHGNLL
jgi:hypothetical protein